MKRNIKVVFAVASLGAFAIAGFSSDVSTRHRSPSPVWSSIESNSPLREHRHQDEHESAKSGAELAPGALDTNPDPTGEAYAKQMSEVNAKLDRDPVAKRIPMLFDVPKEKQLETLVWMRDLPPAKLLSAIPDIAKDPSASVEERRKRARETVNTLIDDLRNRAHGA